MPKKDNGRQQKYVTSVAAKKEIFRLRLISAKPRRIHPRRIDTTESTSAGSSVDTIRKRADPVRPVINLSPPLLPNVVDESEAEPSTHPPLRSQPASGQTVLVEPVDLPPEHQQNDTDSVQMVSHQSMANLPTINIRSTTPILTQYLATPEVMQSLDVPSLADRSRAGSVTTLSSSGLLTTPSSASIFGSDGVSRASSCISFMVRERLHSLARDINRRTNVMKEHIQQPPTPDAISLSSSVGDESARNEIVDKRSLYSFGSYSARSPINQATPAVQGPTAPVSLPTAATKIGSTSALLKRVAERILPDSIDSQSKKYLIWLIVVSLCWLYNAYAIPLRYAFPYQTKENVAYWLLADYTCDLVYLMDMIIFKPCLRFMRDGLPVKDYKETKKHYLHGWYFKLDVLSLLPLDIFYFIHGVGVNPMLRLHRLFKIRSFWDTFYILDSAVKNPYALRIGKTLSYMMYMIHCNGCIYYSLSSWEGIGSSTFTYDGRGNKYLRCFYFAAKLATSIGNNPDPTNFIEFVYMTICWMLGVFVFALLLGQIRDIVATANKNKEIFRKTMDAALDYCAALNLPKETKDKVRLWFIYTWQEQKTLSENLLLEKLPLKLQTDLAISVHYQVLSKVQLFQDCDKALLRDLVLKLKPVLYLPGDYVCRKGEVGKEMYIVNKGVVEVVGGANNDVVFATLREGSVFGEISLLALAGGNRRTADVRSKGFSNLFVLSKTDLNETIRDYPEAQRMLRRKAKKLIKSDEQKREVKPRTDIEKACEVSTRMATPRLLPVVAQVVDPSTSAGKLLQMVLQEDQSKRKRIRDRPNSGTSDISDTSSIVDDVMAGMPIEQVIQLHCENRPSRTKTDRLEKEDQNSSATGAQGQVRVVDETSDMYRVESIEEMQNTDETGSVDIKVTTASGTRKMEEEDGDGQNELCSDEHRVAVSELFPSGHGKYLQLPGVPRHENI